MLSESLRGINLFLISIPFFFLIINPAIIVYYFSIQIYPLLIYSWMIPVFFYFMGLFYALIYLVETFIILKIIYNPKKKQGVFDIRSINHAIIYFSLSEILLKTVAKIFSILLIPETVYANLIFKIFGKHCGKKSLINPINDVYLISIGEESVIGYGSLIIAHEIVGKKITLKEVKIGKRVTVGANSIISPGVVIEDDVILGAKSYVKKNSVLKKGKFYAGCPAVLKKRKSK